MMKLTINNFITNKKIQTDLEWCLNNYNNINIHNKETREKYELVIKYLLNTKIKKIFLTKEEIKMMIMFFSKDFAYKLELDEKIEFKIQPDDPNDPTVHGRCISKKEKPHVIIYYEKTIDLFLKQKKFPVLPLQILFHEIVHAMQNEIIYKVLPYEENKKYNLEIYMFTLENLLKKVDKDFYDINYKKVYKEKNADKLGLYHAIIYLKKYMPKAYIEYDKTKISKEYEKYEIDYYNTYINCLGSVENYFETMDALTIAYILKNKNILEKYPVLKLAYKENGTRKNIIEILEERKKLLSIQSEDEINRLFEVLLNKKNYGENLGLKLRMEISLLVKYLEQNKDNDKFIYGLLNYRLNKLKELNSLKKQVLFDLKENNPNKSL